MNHVSPIKLYYSPLACSLAARIALYEAGVEATFLEVDPRTKRLADGADYRAIYPLALVPALQLGDGTLLTENIAVLAYIASMGAGAGPDYEVLRWLGYIATELHKGTFNPLFLPGTPEAVKSYAIEKGASRLLHIDAHMRDRDYVAADDFTVADAYLYTVLNWAQATPIALADYPALARYHERVRQRASVARAFAEELPRYLARQAAS